MITTYKIFRTPQGRVVVNSTESAPAAPSSSSIRGIVKRLNAETANDNVPLIEVAWLDKGGEEKIAKAIKEAIPTADVTHFLFPSEADPDLGQKAAEAQDLDLVPFQ